MDIVGRLFGAYSKTCAVNSFVQVGRKFDTLAVLFGVGPDFIGFEFIGVDELVKEIVTTGASLNGYHLITKTFPNSYKLSQKSTGEGGIRRHSLNFWYKISLGGLKGIQ